MNKLIVKNERIEKICSFYVSDFHLEMILIPYINEKIAQNEEVEIISEKNLRETVNTLISKMNINEENKKRILELKWDKNQEIVLKDNMIVVGTKEYLEKINNKIEEEKTRNIKLVNCFDFEEVKGDMGNIIKKYDKSLNTLGFNVW